MMTHAGLEQMTQPTKITTYVLDAESAAEQARLIDQDALLTEAMGGPLSEHSGDVTDRLHDVLDITCGPGGWVQHVARDYPHMQVTGIDLSTSMIAFAHTRAKVMRLNNAHFHVMDATQSLAFPDASFDLVNARLISGFVLPEQWRLLLAECQRVLRSGGILRLTEGEWGIVTTAAPATAHLFGLGAIIREGMPVVLLLDLSPFCLTEARDFLHVVRKRWQSARTASPQIIVLTTQPQLQAELGTRERVLLKPFHVRDLLVLIKQAATVASRSEEKGAG